ncbi:MAG TPA: amino acid adenylation domain-containing protein, partial [Longimicrobiaceae bacterium]|nr:amino acid adenylation domain-containing protein [Longimicrobiaceae bacterium]
MTNGTIGGLSGDDLELLALLLDEVGIETAKEEAIRPRRPGQRVPLTFPQKRLWFMEQLEPESRIYNNVIGIRLTGELDDTALARALDEIVRRHESLRTVFPEVDGEPAQVVLPDFRIPLERHDLSYLPEDERMREVRHVLDAESLRPVTLATGPLVRATLVRMGARDHALILPLHHIVSDGWSMGIFFRELAALYAAFQEGRPSPLAPLPLQYADFAVWQEERLSGGALERQISYWKERLRGAPPLLELPTDRPRPAEQSYRGAAYETVIPAGVAAGLRALAQREGTTLFMTLLAALAALFGRYAGEQDVIVGSPIANRTRPELEGIIGLFANTLPLRTDLSGDPPFRELLARVRDATFEDYAHQDLPFERLVEELRIERSLSFNPVYQAMLVLQNTPGKRDELPGLEMHPLETAHDRAKLDLSLSLAEMGDEICGGWEYATDLFDRATVVRMTDHLVNLLRAAVEDPGRRVPELPLITPEERTRVLHGWSAGAPTDATALPVHLQVRARAAERPDAVAVWHAGEALTYAELDRRASRLAHHLQRRGVGPETRVGVFLERSPELLVALLGVLGAGAVYVPLDPVFPRDRLALLAEDARVALVLTEQRWFAELPGSVAATAVLLDADRERIEREPATPPEAPVFPESAAYVIYTSGSTGRPKGVTVPHGALARYTGAARAAYGVGPDDRVLQFASVAFDASAEEIYTALTAGARLVLRDEEMLDSARAFLERCREWGITVLDLPTAYWHELAAELADGERAELPEALRLVVIGGERALPERLRAWRERFGGRVRLVNTYGPTETTIVATLCDLPATPEEAGVATPRHVPIGRPVAGARVYVLDPRGEPAPIGVPGELYIGGVGVARGYLDRPELTAERFLPDPFAAEPGARVYRTGDRVRWLASGELEFVGRADQQVKIRGFRVEPGEVEAVLARQPGVEDAVVVARQDEADREAPRLVAYLVPEPGSEPTPAELRAALRAELPAYMVPAAWVTLDAFPLTRTGKVDRRALPAPDAATLAREAVRAAPQSGVERAVAEAWREVLGVEEVGLDDIFFDLGGTRCSWRGCAAGWRGGS